MTRIEVTCPTCGDATIVDPWVFTDLRAWSAWFERMCETHDTEYLQLRVTGGNA